MDKTLGDKIPEFNKKGGGGGNVGLSGASFSMGDHRTKLETLVIILVAVIIIGGSRIADLCASRCRNMCCRGRARSPRHW